MSSNMIPKHIRIESSTNDKLQRYMQENDLDNEAKLLRELIEIGLYVKMNNSDSDDNIEELSNELEINAHISTLSTEHLLRDIYHRIFRNDFDTNVKMKEYNQTIIDKYYDILK